MSRTLHGTTEIEVNGTIYALLPTLAAVRAIESRFGGLNATSSALQALSVDACASVILAGADLDEKRRDVVAENVWFEGVFEVSIKLSKYLAALYNPGGKTSGKAPEPEASTS
jgi:hypothetical protein